MILPRLKAVESGAAPSPLEEIETELQQNLSPEKFRDKVETLAAESVSLLCRQIVQSMDSGFQKLESAIGEPFSLGYLTGFTMGFLEVTGQRDERIKILVLQIAIDFVFGEEGKATFKKLAEYLGIGEIKFREGLQKGYQEVVERIELEKEPVGLKAYLTNI